MTATTTTTKSTPIHVRPFAKAASPQFQAATPLAASKFSDRRTLTEMAKQQQQLTESLAVLPEAVKVSMGFRSNELIVGCTYDGSPCNIERSI
jgi:hypothetical protein